MRRPIAAATIAAVLFIQALPATAAPAGRVVLVTLDGTRLGDWRSTALPALGRVMRDGAVALLSTRTARNPADQEASGLDAYRTLGGGRISRAADPRTLFRTLDRAFARATVIAGSGDASAALTSTQLVIPERTDATFPSGARADLTAAQGTVFTALAESRTIVINLGDTTRVERIHGANPAQRAVWMRLALVRADAFIGWLRTRLSPEDTLIVASLTPPHERQEHRRFLTAVAAVGPAIRTGMLTSATTEREGVVTIADLAPTMLRIAGVPIPASMTGRPMRVVARAAATGDLAALERDLVHASVVRGPLLRGGVVAASVLAVLSLLTVLAGRGRAGSQRGAPTTWRALLETGFVAIVALPLALFVEPLFGTGSLAATAIAVAATCLGVALVSRAAAGSRAAIATLLGVTAVVVMADLVAGGRLAERSPLSYLITEGARFHGIGNDAMGVVTGSALLGVAAVLDRGLTVRKAAVAVAVLGVVTAVMAAPALGTKLGAVPAAVPAFGFFAVLARGNRITLRVVLGVAIITVLATGLVIAAHALFEDVAGSHVANAVGGGGGEIFGRKVGAAGRLLALSYWIGGLVACGGSIALLAWRRPVLLGRGLWGRPVTRAALIGCAVAAAGSIAGNDAGVTAAAWVTLFAAGTVFSALLVPSDP